MNKLTSSIFRNLYTQNHKKNFVFSPASYMLAINNLLLCLKNDNLQEFLDLLNISEENLFEYIKQYRETVDKNVENYDALFIRSDYENAANPEVVEQFKQLKSEIKGFSQQNISNLIDEINRIAAEKTHGKIQNLLSPNDISNYLSFVILNCVYFKKEWVYKFNESGAKETFYGVDSHTQINFLRKRDKGFAFYEDEKIDIVELPYQYSSVACYLLIPKTNVFELINNLEENYNKIKLVKLENNTEVDITTPRFKIESSYSLEESTRFAGVNKIFEWNKDWKLVDFSKLLPEVVLKVDKIIQKAYIDFTKDGTEAAAATAIMMACSSCVFIDTKPKIKYIRADKPFMYVLLDKNNKDVPLFIGVVNQAEEFPNSPKFEGQWQNPFFDSNIKPETYMIKIDGVSEPLTGIKFTNIFSNSSTNKL